MRLAHSVLLVTALSLPGIQTAQSKRPELPFFDWNACPFEGCTYREWTALKPVVVYDTWERTRTRIAKLAKGEKVTAITGVVIIFKPGIIRMDRDLPQDGLKRGDMILTYAYRGEGAWAVWFDGKYVNGFEVPYAKRADGKGCLEDCAATELQDGNKEWWAKIKLKSGKTAWVNMDKDVQSFDGVDLLG
jgi:hypothetical protein